MKEPDHLSQVVTFAKDESVQVETVISDALLSPEDQALNGEIQIFHADEEATQGTSSFVKVGTIRFANILPPQPGGDLSGCFLHPLALAAIWLLCYVIYKIR